MSNDDRVRKILKFEEVLDKLQTDLKIIKIEEARLQNERKALVAGIKAMKKVYKEAIPAPRKSAATTTKKKRQRSAPVLRIDTEVHELVAMYHLSAKQPLTSLDVARFYASNCAGNEAISEVEYHKLYRYLQKAALVALHSLVEQDLARVVQEGKGKQPYSFALTSRAIELLKNEEYQRELAQADAFVDSLIRKRFYC